MARYFKLIEIDCDSFVEATGEDLGSYSQLIVPVTSDMERDFISLIEIIFLQPLTVMTIVNVLNRGVRNE